MATPERVVIAAAGVVTPIGQDLEAFWSSLVTGASGISQIERVPVADLRVQRGGEVKRQRSNLIFELGNYSVNYRVFIPDIGAVQLRWQRDSNVPR